MYTLNAEQAKGFSNFFFDVAKGLVLGGVGSVVISPIQTKYIIGILSGIFAGVCIKMALVLLEDIDK